MRLTCAILASLRIPATRSNAMCGFCAVFSGVPHWTETASDAGDRAQQSGGPAWRVGRQQRLRVINAVVAHFGCRVEDWMGGQFLVSSQRGRSEMVDHLPQVWRVVEDIAQRPLDPLDPVLLAALRRAPR